MDAGQLDQLIGLEQNQRIADDMGGGAGNWVEVAELWARVAPLRGREQIVAQKEDSRTVYRVTCYRDAVAELPAALTDLRLVWKTNNSVTMNIREDMDAGLDPLFAGFLAETMHDAAALAGVAGGFTEGFDEGFN